MDEPNAQLFKALARAAELRMCDFKSRGLANTAWAFAIADESDALLFVALAWTVERRLGDFTAHDRSCRLHRVRALQHVVGVCDSKPAQCTVVYGVGVGSGAAPRRLQRAVSRQRGVGVCDGEPARCAVICGVTLRAGFGSW